MLGVFSPLQCIEAVLAMMVVLARSQVLWRQEISVLTLFRSVASRAEEVQGELVVEEEDDGIFDCRGNFFLNLDLFIMVLNVAIRFKKVVSEEHD